MHKSLDVFILSGDVRGIMACYEPNGTSALFKTFDEDIAVDDYIVVETNTRHNMTVVQVTAVDVEPDYNDDTPVKWVINKVCLRALDNILEAELDVLDLHHRGRQIYCEMHEAIRTQTTATRSG